MTLPDGLLTAKVDMGEPNTRTHSVVRLSHVSKVYRLYGSPSAYILDSIGLYRLPLFRSRRPTFRQFYALNQVTLDVFRGERIGIIGRNGAGKTTLLKLITGNFAATEGEVLVRGSVQALMQVGLGFHPEFSGYENIRAALNYNGLTGQDFDDGLRDVIDFVELGEFLHQPLKTYSQGMAARVQFAAATAIRPDILIIDEILGAGDAYFTGKCAHRMQQLTSSGCTLLLVSHSTQQILQFCNKAIWLEEGRIRMRGDALEVVKAYEEFIEHLRRRPRTHQLHPDTRGMSIKDFATPHWQKERLASLLADPNGARASSVSRWPAEKGLKIACVRVLDHSGTAVETVRSGEPLTIDVEFMAEFDSQFEFRVAILLMTLDGVALTRHLSDPFLLSMTAGDTRRIQLRYERTLLAAGEFVFSAALFRSYDPDDSSTAIRYDLLSRSFRLKVIPRHTSEPALFNHPSEWQVLPSGARRE